MKNEVQKSPSPIRLSASSMATFKTCPRKYWLSYEERIKPEIEADVFRMGSNWHKIHEIHANEGQEAATKWLYEWYQYVPETQDPDKWETEYGTILASYLGYHWHFADDPVEVEDAEYPFQLPVTFPGSGLTCDRIAIRVGTIDGIAVRDGKRCLWERKSTTHPIDAESKYWNHLRLDTQINTYDLAAHDLVRKGEMEPIDHIMYDVWRKPAIRIKDISIKDTNTLMQTGVYFGTKFVVEQENEMHLILDGNDISNKLVKKKSGISLRETPQLFTARLLAAICEHPERYFQRRVISRTAADREEALAEVFAIQQSIGNARRTQTLVPHDRFAWPRHEHSCDSPYPCRYKKICHNNMDVSVEIPEGFTRLTVKGKS